MSLDLAPEEEPAAVPEDAHETQPPFIKTCGCGLTYSRLQWSKLPFVGVQVLDPETGELADLRNCACGSTLSVLLAWIRVNDPYEGDDGASATIAEFEDTLRARITELETALRTTHLHTDECLAYAALTRRSFCIDACAQARRKLLADGALGVKV
jgi:hypothetical protein